LSSNPTITWGIICSNPDKEWDYHSFLGFNPNITPDIVQTNLNRGWCYRALYWNSNFMSKLTKDHGPVMDKLELVQEFYVKLPDWRTMCSKNKINYLSFDRISRCGDKYSLKIQHVFRRWRRRLLVDVNTIQIISST
jgi:hypothetical protein